MTDPTASAGSTPRYGSDLVIETLIDLGIEYVALNPGASFRGIHDSLVARGAPKPILCLTENMALAVAHGYAKATGKPMAVMLHNLVGLQSGSMGIFNAWADQVPVVIIGGAGPADASARRPWIDWVHSARPQALVARDYMKWDDEPTSLGALVPSIQRGFRIATSAPCGPTYIAVDTMLQEAELPAGFETARMAAEDVAVGLPTFALSEEHVSEIADALLAAERPLLIADYVGRTREGYDALQRLVELVGCPVVDLQARHNFPSRHPSDVTGRRKEFLRRADFVLALELRDLFEGIGEAEDQREGVHALTAPDAQVVDLGLNQLMHRGFLDYSSPSVGAREIVADSSVALVQLVRAVEERIGTRPRARIEIPPAASTQADTAPTSDGIDEGMLAEALREAIGDSPWLLANGHLRGAIRRSWDMRDFNCHLGRNVGAGLGYGLGVSVGAALAHVDDETLVVDVQNDGDLLYTASGLWTAAHDDTPVLVVVANNRTYGQDRFHQSEVARARGRGLESVGVGIDIDDPPVDFAGLARSQGVAAAGPIDTVDALRDALRDAVRVVREERRPFLVDVLVGRRATWGA